MSLWFDQLRIGLGVDRMVWVRVARGLRPRVIEKREITVPAGDGGTVWAAALNTLKNELAKTTLGRTECAVVFANRLVRYVIVPWHPELMRRAERITHARHCFKETYGDVARGWDVTIADTRHGEPVLAAAVDQQLLAGLREVFRGMRLRSIQPYLTLAYTRFRKTIAKGGSGPAYFGVVDADDLGLIRFANGQLQGVFNQRISGDWRMTLQGLLLQVAEEGEAQRTVSVLAPGHAAAELLGATRINRVMLPALPGYSPLSDPDMAMGMVGI